MFFNRSNRRALSAIALGIAISGLFATVPLALARPGGDAPSRLRRSKTVNTTAAVRDTHWGDNVAITFDKRSFHFRSNGIPNHPVAAEYVMPDAGSTCNVTATADCTHVEPAAQAIQAGPVDVTITTRPQKVPETVSIKAGPMGVLISGSPVYNPFEGDGTTIAMNSNFTLTDAQGQQVPFLDSCNAHPAPHPIGMYHYHGLPTCVTAQVDQPNGPSHIIGYALDGFPVYGDRDINGEQIKPETLDVCNGIESPTPEFPKGIYHYVLLDVPTVQSTIRCLHGKLDFPLPGGCL